MTYPNVGGHSLKFELVQAFFCILNLAYTKFKNYNDKELFVNYSGPNKSSYG